MNPRQIRDFARSTGRLAKTDAIDAHTIAPASLSLSDPMPAPSQTPRLPISRPSSLAESNSST